MSKINRAIIVIIGSNLFANAYANDQYRSVWDDISMDLGVGTFSTSAKKRLYEPTTDRKHDQANWRMRNAPTLKGEVAWQVLPKLSLGLSGWTTLAKHGGKADQYTWGDENQQSWTSSSHHPKSYVDRVNQFDLNLKYWLLSSDVSRIGVMSGYQQTRYRSSAYGGSYNFDNGTEIDEVSHDLLTISYRQTYKTPYIGLLASYRYQKWEVGGEVKYSAWGRASDRYDHHNADATFTSLITKQKSTSLSLNGGYYLTENTKVYLEGIWGRTFNRKGTSHYYDHEEGTSESSKKGAGTENTSLMASLGFRYNF